MAKLIELGAIRNPEIYERVHNTDVLGLVPESGVDFEQKFLPKDTYDIVTIPRFHNPNGLQAIYLH